MKNRLFFPHLPLAMLIVISSLLVLLPIAPSMVDQGRDSGIYAYTAKVIVEKGGLPYRDAWDNKPPGIYYIDAAAFWLLGVSRWSLWITELLFIALAAAAFCWLWYRVSGSARFAALGAVVFMLLARNPALTGNGNLTESYALLPQMLCLALGYQLLRKPGLRWALGLGLAASMAFLIKQSTMGVALAFIPAMALSGHPVSRDRRRWHWLGGMIAGGLVGLAMPALYLAAYGVLDDALHASFIGASKFHQWVSGEPVPLWRTLASTLGGKTFSRVFLSYMPFILLAAVLAWRLRFQRSRGLRATGEMHYRALVIWGVLTFIADLLVLNPTNRAYSHYYITLVPSLSLLLMAVLHWLLPLWQQPAWRYRLVAAGAALYLAVLGATNVTALIGKVEKREGPLFGPVIQERIADYVQERTAPEDTVLVWGASTDINFQADRASPTRFNYAYPLIVPGYTEAANVEELIEDLQENEPPIIIDSAISDGDRVPPLGEEDRATWVAEGGRTDTFDLEPLFEFVEQHCLRLRQFEDEAVIYFCYYNDSF